MRWSWSRFDCGVLFVGEGISTPDELHEIYPIQTFPISETNHDVVSGNKSNSNNWPKYTSLSGKFSWQIPTIKAGKIILHKLTSIKIEDSR